MDMATPGVTVKPIITLAGDHEVNQVFFDNVRVPKANRLGEENQGWTVAKYLLEFERGGGSAPGLKRGPGPGAGGGRRSGRDDRAHRRRLAEAQIAIEAIDMSERRVLSALASGNPPGPASSMLKINGTEATQRLDEIAIAALGAYANVEQIEAREPGSNVEPVGPEIGLTAMPRYLNNRAATIYGGSNEIQRDIIARLVLGL
jgi:acyl-CoA dehydrogenase